MNWGLVFVMFEGWAARCGEHNVALDQWLESHQLLQSIKRRQWH
jgi:hypothetical protein